MADEMVEIDVVFDLHPMAAATENVQLGILDPAIQGQRIAQRDHAVVTAMNDQRLVPDRPDVRFGARHGINPTLTRCWKHGRERFLKTGTDAGLVTQLGQFVVNQATVEGKDVE